MMIMNRILFYSIYPISFPSFIFQNANKILNKDSVLVRKATVVDVVAPLFEPNA